MDRDVAIKLNLQNDQEHELSSLDVTVLVPISERHDDLENLYQLYSSELASLGKSFEFLFVIDGVFSKAHQDLERLQSMGKPVRIIKFPKTFGESSALMEGFRQARGDAVLTLASYVQIEPDGLAEIFSAYENGSQLVITQRHPRIDPLLNKIQSRVYHYLVRKLTGAPFKDITCGARLIDKEVLSQITLYGDLHRFIPIFAHHKGIRVEEVKVRQRKDDARLRLVKPGIYLRRFLDIQTIFFLVKFTQKPLRFFGLIGSFLGLTGGLITGWLGFLRIFGEISLSNRPMLLLGVLLLVFGIQIFSVGLLGELILYTHAKKLSNYRIEEIIE